MEVPDLPRATEQIRASWSPDQQYANYTSKLLRPRSLTKRVLNGFLTVANISVGKSLLMTRFSKQRAF